MACFSLQLTSVRQLLRWSCLLLKIQPSVVFFFSARIFTPAFQLKHTRSARRRPSCLCLPAPSSLPCRSILGDGGGISAAGKRERKQENVSGFGQRGAALCSCAPVCTRQASPGEEDTATISAKNTVSTSPFQSDWTATSLRHLTGSVKTFYCDKRTLVLTRQWNQQRAGGVFFFFLNLYSGRWLEFFPSLRLQSCYIKDELPPGQHIDKVVQSEWGEISIVGGPVL